MTSQKSLNNVNRNDFVRSLKESLPFPAIAFAVLFILVTIPIIQYVTAEEFVTAREHFEYSMFLAPQSTFYFNFELLPVGMIICGMLTALKSFYFMLSKKQVNVHLSLGLKRNTMVTNRVISGIISLFVAVFVPILMIYITNIVCFGMSAHLTKLFVYFVSLLFVCGLIGYSVVSAMSMVSGNIFEAGISSLALSVTPFCLFVTFYSLCNGYLKGYIRNFDVDTLLLIFTPWTMAVNIQEEYPSISVNEMYVYSDRITPKSILNLLVRDTTADKFKVPEYLNVDWGFLFPIVMWLVVSLALIGVTYYLFNKRKAEHANSLGKFPVSRAVLGTCAFTAITWISSEWFAGDISPFALMVIIVIVTLIAYFLIQLILTKKPKTAFKSLRWYVVLVGTLVVSFVLINTGFFGTYNKIPDKADVKSVTIEASALNAYPHYIYPWDVPENFVESSTDNSKEVVLEIFKLFKEEKYEYDKESFVSITLGIRDNEGKIKFRNFYLYSEETYMKYVQLVYGSDYFDAILKNYLVDDVAENPQINSTGWLKTYEWAYTDKDMIYKIDDGLTSVEDVDGLCDALYKDLSVMGVDELFKNNNQPVGILVKYNPDTDFVGTSAAYAENVHYPLSEDGEVYYTSDKVYEEVDHGYALIHNDFIPVYPEMTNTIDFLKANGYEITDEPMKIKEVLYTDTSLSLTSARSKFAEENKRDYRGWGTYTDMLYDVDTAEFDLLQLSYGKNSAISYFIDEPATDYEIVNKLYTDIGHPLTSVTDTEKAQEIFDKTVSDYMFLGDQGRFVYVVFEEGPIVCYYLPEANMSVIK